MITRRGFSLLEMLAVLLIMGLLVALVVPRIGAASASAKVKTTRADIAGLANAVEQFRVDLGRLPTEEEGLDVLVHPPGDAGDAWRMYLGKREIPSDAWGNDFIYRTETGDPRLEYLIISLGADGEPGGTGDDADLDNWQ